MYIYISYSNPNSQTHLVATRRTPHPISHSAAALPPPTRNNSSPAPIHSHLFLSFTLTHSHHRLSSVVNDSLPYGFVSSLALKLSSTHPQLSQSLTPLIPSSLNSLSLSQFTANHPYRPMRQALIEPPLLSLSQYPLSIDS